MHRKIYIAIIAIVLSSDLVHAAGDASPLANPSLIQADNDSREGVLLNTTHSNEYSGGPFKDLLSYTEFNKPILSNGSHTVQNDSHLTPFNIEKSGAPGANIARISVVSAPAYKYPQSLDNAFNGDFSNTLIPLLYQVSGAATMGDGSHYWSPGVTPFNSVTLYRSGVNKSLRGNSGRTGYATYRTIIKHSGQGDAGAYNSICRLSGLPQQAAETFLANAACFILNGDLSSQMSGGFLQGIGDLNFSDNGFDTAAVADVRNFYRKNNAAALGEIWIGYRLQSLGTKPFDVLVSGSGPGMIGVDTTQMTVLKAAVNMGPNQKIVFDSTASPMAGVKWYGNLIGGSYIEYSTVHSSTNPNSRSLEIGFDGAPVANFGGDGVNIAGSIRSVSTKSHNAQTVIWNQLDDSGGGIMAFEKSRAVGGAEAAARGDDLIGEIAFRGADSTGEMLNSSTIQSIVKETERGSVTSAILFRFTNLVPLSLDSSGVSLSGQLSIEGRSGVNCSSPPSTSFTTINGIVTHC